MRRKRQDSKKIDNLQWIQILYTFVLNDKHQYSDIFAILLQTTPPTSCKTCLCEIRNFLFVW